MTANRISGFLVLLTGIALIFVVIPIHTETVGSGWMKPQTLPEICAVALVVFGGFQAIFPTGAVSASWKEAARAGLFALFAAGGIWLFSVAGFRVGAPTLALVVMLAVGERRPVWLLVGVVLLPAFVWAAVVLALDRPLP